MFHISTPFDYSHSSPFSRYPSSSLSSANAYLPPSYASYDEERSRIEQALLARKQQERRQAEAAAFAAEQRRIERQAAIAEAIREERERREYERALRYREEMVRKAREEEEAKERYIRAMRVQQELSRRQQLEEQQEQGRRNERATEQRQINQDKIPDLFQLLFGGRSPETTRRTEPAPAAQPSTPSPLQTQPSRSEQPQLDLPHFLGAIFGTPQTSTTTQAPPTSQQAPASISQLSPSPVAQTSSSPSSAPDLSTPAPASTPIVEPQPPVDSPSSDEEEEAATKLQRHFRRHLARRNALDKISSLSSSFLDRQSTFEKPTSLTFQSSLDATSSTTTPSLAFVSSNSPFLAYEDYLVNLLSKIDAVESGGDKQVKSERKSLVRKVEMELSRLDAMKERAWEEQVKAVKAESMLEDKKVDASTAEPVQDSPSSSDSPASLTSDTTEYEDTSLPSLLPLTHDAVSSLPTSSPPSLSRSPSDSGSSTTSSTLTVSSASSQIDQYISEMLRRAQKLGEQVEKMELEEESKPREVVIA